MDHLGISVRSFYQVDWQFENPQREQCKLLKRQRQVEDKPMA
jgi:hypothetical protein